MEPICNDKLYHYFYRIDNIVNGKFYYGIHSTNDLSDGYMGSGSRLNEDKLKLGIESFKKTIIKTFGTREEASDYEANFVTEELVKDINCYNIKVGGDYGETTGSFLVIDKNGVMHRSTENDEKFNNGEWVPFGKGTVSCFLKENNMRVRIPKDEFDKNRDLYYTKYDGLVVVKDKRGNITRVNINDDRYKSGELVPIWLGRRHSEKTKDKQKESFRKIGHQKGEKNSSYGTVWITNGCVSKKIPLNDLNSFLLDGWRKGRVLVLPEKCYANQVNLNKELVIKKLSSGQTKISIAKEFGISKNALYRYIKRNKIDISPCRRTADNLKKGSTP